MADPLRNALSHRLRTLFDRVPVVVWADPSGGLLRALRAAAPPEVTVPDFQGNLWSLRAELDRTDPWFERKWLLLVPPLPGDSPREWLRDLEEAFHVERADLARVLRDDIGMTVPAELVPALRAAAGATLAADFDAYVTDDGPYQPHTLASALVRAALVRPAASDEDLVVLALADDGLRDRLEAAGVGPAWRTLLRLRFGAGGEAVDALRLAKLGAQVALGAQSSSKASAKPVEARLAGPWRQVVDKTKAAADGKALMALSQAAASMLDVTDPFALASGPAFESVDVAIERALASRAEGADKESWADDVITVARERCDVGGLDAARRARWGLIERAGRLLAECVRAVRSGAQHEAATVADLIHGYGSAQGKHRLDTWHRELSVLDERDPLDKVLFAPARVAHQAWVQASAEQFVEALRSRRLGPVQRQTRFWATFVQPRPLAAVLLVDALRADMAHELHTLLTTRGFEVTCAEVLAEVPSITKVGMAALLPGADADFGVDVTAGGIAARIGSQRVADTTERNRYLDDWAARNGAAVVRRPVDAWTEPGAIEQAHRSGAIAIAWTTEIDDNGDAAATLGFDVLGRTLSRYADFVGAALRAGYDRVVVATDHGFLMKPRRDAAAGIGGVPPSDASFVRTTRYAAGVAEDMAGLVRLTAAGLGRTGADVFVPRDAACLAISGGAPSFIHGGVSLQECALVFLTVRRDAAGQDGPPAAEVVIRAPAKATSLSFKVTIAGVPAGGRAEAVDAAGKVVWTKPDPAGDTMVTTRRAGTVRVRVVSAAGVVLDEQSVDVVVLGDDFF